MSNRIGNLVLKYFGVSIVAFGINNAIAQTETKEVVEHRIKQATKTLKKEGYQSLPCTKENCQLTFWKKENDHSYYATYQIGETGYFREINHFTKRTACNTAVTYAKKLEELPLDTLDAIDSNNNYIISRMELINYFK